MTIAVDLGRKATKQTNKQMIGAIGSTDQKMPKYDPEIQFRIQLHNKTIKHSFPYININFAKSACDSVLQPEPRSRECCNTLSHEGLAHVNIRKRMLYCHCYIPFFQAQAAPNNFIQLYAKMSTVTS